MWSCRRRFISDMPLFSEFNYLNQTVLQFWDSFIFFHYWNMWFYITLDPTPCNAFGYFPLDLTPSPSSISDI